MSYLLLRNELNGLVEKGEGLCVSIYMPTHRGGTNNLQDTIRFKIMLGEAEEQLLQRGMSLSDITDLLKPAKALLEAGSIFRGQKKEGLALFISAKKIRFYTLPITFKQSLTIAEKFQIKPLVPLLSGDGEFYVLALSLNKIRLIKGSRFATEEITLDNVPQCIDEALKYDDKPQKQGLLRSKTTGGKWGRKGMAFFGTGSGTEEEKDKIQRFFNLVNNGLNEIIKDDRIPLVLAGVDYLLPIFKQTAEYPLIIEKGIPGNPDKLSIEELQQTGWELIKTYYQKEQREDVAQYEQYSGTGLTSGYIKEIVIAAKSGRIKALFVDQGIELFGIYNPDDSSVEMHQYKEDADEDLLELAVYHTILNGGTVYPIEILPTSKGTVAAVFRY